MKREEKRRFLSLDILRGLAALSVVASHLHGWAAAPRPSLGDRLLARWDHVFHWLFIGGGTGAHPGVVLFIVLSGFCIHLPQAGKTDLRYDGRFWRQFAWRRIWRIGPVYWFAVILGIVAMIVTARWASVVPVPVFGNIALVPVLEKLTFVNAWLPSRATELGNVPLRTVAVEVFLYVGYVAVVGLRKRLGWIGVFGAAGCIYLFGLALIRLGADGAFIHESFFSFFLYWVAGAYSADVFVCDQRTARYRRSAAATALGLFALNFLLQRALRFRGAFVITVPVLAASIAFLLYAVMSAEAKFANRPSIVSRFMAGLGERSYTLYAVHTPAIIFACLAAAALRNHGANFWATQELTLAAVMTIAMTILVYETVEKPSHRLARKKRRESIPALSAKPTIAPAQFKGEAAPQAVE